MRVTNFEDDLKKSINPNTALKNYIIVLREFGNARYIESIYLTEKDKEKAPNDFVIGLEGQEQISVDFKNYSEGKDSSKVFLEIKNDIYSGSWGWTFYPKCDYIVFVWQGKYKDCYLILDAHKLAKWWEISYVDYKELKNDHTRLQTERGVRTWQSSFAAVPIDNIPDVIKISHERFVDLLDFTDWR